MLKKFYPERNDDDHDHDGNDEGYFKSSRCNHD